MTEIITICFNIPYFNCCYCVSLSVFMAFENSSQKWAWLNGCALYWLMSLHIILILTNTIFYIHRLKWPSSNSQSTNSRPGC